MIILALFLQVDSLSVSQAIDIAFQNSPIYHESRVALDRSRIQFYQSLANLLPTINVTGTYTKSEFDGFTSSDYTGAMNINMPLFDLDIISSIFVARGELGGNNIQHQADISNLILRIKTAYYNLINAYELLNSSEITLERAQENLNLVQAKYELGSASRLELLQGEVFYLNAQQDRSRARTLEISAQEELRSILGTSGYIYPIDTLIAPEVTDMPDLDSLTKILHAVNYEVRLARQLRDLSKINLISSYLAFLPRISLFYGYNVSSDTFVFDFQYYRDNAVKNYGISVSFPIFEIKNLVFRYLNAKNDLRRSEFAERRAELETEKQLRTTYYLLRESLDKLQYAEKSLDAANEAAVISRERYALGVTSFLDFLTAEKSVYDARVSYSSALSDYYVQQATFSYLLGTLALGKEQ
ncbi:MAG: TolC family protein [candidate division WOR-3 bacterium]|nr:MAG: TolC family protein [candidate division WOR-3 bacterium]